MNCYVRRRLVWLTAVCTVVAAFGLSPAYSGEDLWIVSTRRVASDGCDAVPSDSPLDYWHLNDGCQWAAADAAAFRASDDPTAPTTFVISGNRTDPDMAVTMGWQIFQQLKACAVGRSFRVVIWSWPSDRIRGGIRLDARVKADRCDVESFLLAQTLDRMNPAVRVNLVGHSFGARITLDALELLAGGSINGQTLPRKNQPAWATRQAMLVAAALDSDWLLKAHRDGQALGQVDRLLITVNPDDFVLRHYGLMYHMHGPQALGSTGPVDLDCLAETAKVELLDLTCSVGRRHDWNYCFCAPDLRAAIARYGFFDSTGNASGAQPVQP